MLTPARRDPAAASMLEGGGSQKKNNVRRYTGSDVYGAANQQQTMSKKHSRFVGVKQYISIFSLVTRTIMATLMRISQDYNSRLEPLRPGLPWCHVYDQESHMYILPPRPPEFSRYELTQSLAHPPKGCCQRFFPPSYE